MTFFLVIPSSSFRYLSNCSLTCSKMGAQLGEEGGGRRRMER